jgi:curved DNA-binding protein CbpA
VPRDDGFVDYYRVLQVRRDAEPEVIERAYKALSLKYHPDVLAASQRESATRRMQLINEAYRVLRDPLQRRRYDATLPPEGMSRSAWEEFWEKGLVGLFMDRYHPRR